MKSSNTNDYRCQRVSLQLIGAVSFAFQGTILDKQIECKGNYIVSFGSNEISNVLIKFINTSYQTQGFVKQLEYQKYAKLTFK